MKLHGDITINDKHYTEGTEVPWYAIYPFFLGHMLGFGASGFFMAYADPHPSIPHVLFLYLHGGIAIVSYTAFYLVAFGRDAVQWMFINAALGIAGLWCQVDWLLSWFGRQTNDYPVYIHVIPFLYAVFYMFLIRQAILDITDSRENDIRRRCVECAYLAIAVAACLISYLT